jgi:hypothetical protein
VGALFQKSTNLLNFVLPAKGYQKKQLSYANNKRQSLDLYLPKTSARKTPIILSVLAWFNDALLKAGNSDETHIYPGVNHMRLIVSLAAPLHFLNDNYDYNRKFLEKAKV